MAKNTKTLELVRTSHDVLSHLDNFAFLFWPFSSTDERDEFRFSSAFCLKFKRNFLFHSNWCHILSRLTLNFEEKLLFQSSLVNQELLGPSIFSTVKDVTRM